MKPFPVVLVVAALCVQRAASLWCYKCEDTRYHKDCKEVKCSDMDSYCVTARTEITGQEPTVSKWCSPTCPNKSTEMKGGKRNVVCCQSDYCNSASGARGSLALLGVALLASCFYILQTGL